MSPTLELNFWTRLLGILALEIGLIVALVFAVQLLTQSAFWRRTIWQICFVCLLLLVATELTGFGCGLAVWISGKPVAERKFSIRSVPADEQFTAQPVESEMSEPVLIPQIENTPVARTVWWPGMIWLAGLSLIVARILFARCLFFTLRFQREKISDPNLLERVSELAKRLGIRRKIHLLESNSLSSPMTFGITHPSIGLPSGFAQTLNSAQQDAMLTHELAHLAARDPFWYLLADLAAAFLWWHPLVWLARRRLHSTSELAADEAAAILENGPGTLAECLVQLGQQLTHSRSFGWLGVDGNGFRSHLGQRVERLLNLQKTEKQTLRGWPLFFAKIAVVIFFGGLIAFTSGWIQNGKEQREKNLSAAVQKSWNGSFASITLAALAEERADSNAKKKADAAGTLLHQEKELTPHAPLSGKTEPVDWDGLFGEDLFAPSNKPAKTKAEQWDELKSLFPSLRLFGEIVNQSEPDLIYPTSPPKLVQNSAPIVPHAPNNSAPRDKVVYTSKGRQAIMAKLDRIRLSEVLFENLPLGEVLKVLATDSKKQDSEHRGINFMFNPRPNAPVAPTNNPNAAAASFVDINKITIHISPPLKDVRLVDVLDAIVQVAEEPLEYKIEDYAVVFSPKATNGITLYTHVFKLDPKTFMEKLEFIDGFNDQITNPSNGTNLQSNINLKVRNFLTIAGVNFGPSGSPNGKAVFFNDKNGQLMVRATMKDLEIIQTALESIDHDDVVTFPDTADETDFQTHVFKVNPRTFLQGLKGDSTQSTASKIRDFLESEGVNFGIPGQPNGKNLYYKDKLGWLMVRATPDDLKKIEKALAPFPPETPQITIETKFVEIDEAAINKLGSNWFSQNTIFLTNQTASSAASVSGSLATAKLNVKNQLTNSHAESISGILTEAQYRTTLKTLETLTGTDILTPPRLTTLSGRQSQIATLDMQTIVTGASSITNAKGDPEITYQTEATPFGPTLDFLPVVSADGFAIQMTVAASIAEFLGYDDPGKFVLQAKGTNGGKPLTATMPLPRFRFRQVTTTANVWDGQTLMLNAPPAEKINKMKDKVPMLGDLPLFGRLFRSESKTSVKKNLIIFITPSIIDPAGNRVHSEKELLFTTNSVPKQPEQKQILEQRDWPLKKSK